MAFRRNSDNLILLRGLTDKAAGTSITTGVTTSSWIFDQDADTVVASDTAAGTTLSIRDPGLYKDGDKIRIEQDDGTLHDTTVSGAPDEDAQTLTLAATLTDTAAAGRPISRRLGVEITGGTTFGAAAQTAFKDDWGWSVPIADTDAVHAELVDVRRIRIETTITHSTSGVLVERIVERVQG